MYNYEFGCEIVQWHIWSGTDLQSLWVQWTNANHLNLQPQLIRQIHIQDTLSTIGYSGPTERTRQTNIIPSHIHITTRLTSNSVSIRYIIYAVAPEWRPSGTNAGEAIATATLTVFDMWFFVSPLGTTGSAPPFSLWKLPTAVHVVSTQNIHSVHPPPLPPPPFTLFSPLFPRSPLSNHIIWQLIFPKDMWQM